jgi:hypothetical protein
MKKILFLAIAVIFVLSVYGLSYAANETYKGTIIKISGHKITIESDAGKVAIVIGKAKYLQVGDKVTVNDGTVIKEGGMPSTLPEVKSTNSKSPNTKQ